MVGLKGPGEGEREEGVGVGGTMEGAFVRAGDAKVKRGNGSKRGGPPQMKRRLAEMGTRDVFTVDIQPFGGDERTCLSQSLYYRCKYSFQI